MPRDVAITGVGLLSGLGIGTDAFWNGLCSGQSAIKPITAFDATAFPSHHAAELPQDLPTKDHVPKGYRKAIKVMARDSELAVIASNLAVRDAGVRTRGTIAEETDVTPSHPSSRTGCHIGAGLIAAETDELTAAFVTARDDSGKFSLARWGTRGPGWQPGGPVGLTGMNNLTPLWMLKYLPNMLACHVTIIHGCEGPSNTMTCSETSSLLCIGESTRVIQRDAADMCLAGGAESPTNLMRFMRMQLSGRLADTREQASPFDIIQPFGPESRGTVLGEGGGLFVIESTQAAEQRGAKTYAIIAGFGAGHGRALWRGGTKDMPSPWDDAGLDEGLQAAIENAMDDARVIPSEIDAIVPHGCGIPNLDSHEAGALRAVFGERLERIPLVPLIPTIGSCLAGHGTMMAATGALCLHHQQLPRTIYLDRRGRADASKASSSSSSGSLRTILVAGGSLGGHAAALVLRRPS